jgi:hypothetical protein
MIHYKTVSSNPELNDVVIANGVTFTISPCSDVEYPSKVVVTNESNDTLSRLQEAEGVVILTEEEFNSI